MYDHYWTYLVFFCLIIDDVDPLIKFVVRKIGGCHEEPAPGQSRDAFMKHEMKLINVEFIVSLAVYGLFIVGCGYFLWLSIGELF